MESAMKTLILSQVSEVDLIYKSKVKASARPKISDSKECHELLRQLWDDGKINMIEQFKTLFLNRANRVVGLLEVSTGGVTGTVADPRIILVAALKVLACNMVLAHNHPSGNLLPSKADEELTQKIKHAAAFHDIKVLDHIILNDEGYYSFADMGLL
jgi:DNA repair protein RadC